MKKFSLKILQHFLVIFAFPIAFCANSAFAQTNPVGRHYAYGVELVELEPSPGELLGMSQPEVLDVNGDGRDDVVFSAIGVELEDPTPLFVLTGNEAGILENSTQILIEDVVPVTERGFRQIIPADFNGDGRLDLFLEATGPEPDCGNSECFPGGQNMLLLSNNDNKLNNVTETHLPTFTDFSHGCSVADFDSDGDIDIFVNNLGGTGLADFNISYLMFNDGLGHFEVVSDMASPDLPKIVGNNGHFPENKTYYNSWSAAVDAEGDGDMDIYLGLTHVAPHCPTFPTCVEYFDYVILLNDGSGHFSEGAPDAIPSYGQDDATFDHVLVYDINGDGLDDLLLAASLVELDFPFTHSLEKSIIQVLISNGDGTFRDESATRLPQIDGANMSDSFQLHDLDGDGHKDLFSYINSQVNDIRINDGEGNFRRLTEDWVQTPQNAIVMDVDGDGGTDFLANQFVKTDLHKMILPYGAKLEGTTGDDRLIGGANNNVYRGLAGNDVLDGGLGDDWLIGGPGDDSLIGGKGHDGYAWLASDLDGQDQIIDKLGKDRLRFKGFDLDVVSLASQDETGGLLINFTSGGSLLIERHFSDSNHRLELLETDECIYRISYNPSFTSGDISQLLSDCILHMSGFEDHTAKEPQIERPCDIESGIWAAEARDCATEDCSDGRWKSWDGKTWSHALITQEGQGWSVTVPPGACTFDFWVDWGAWDLNDCGDGQTSISIDSCGLMVDLTRGGDEQHIKCDLKGETSILIQQPNDGMCEYVIVGDPIFY